MKGQVAGGLQSSVPSCDCTRLSGKYCAENLVEPSGPVQACNGIALPLYLYLYVFSPSFSLLATVTFLVQILFTVSVH